MDRYLANKFLQCSSLKELVSLLKISTSFLQNFEVVSKKYEVFKVKKKTGGLREIEVPNKELKTVQSSLAEMLKEVYSMQAHECCFGYVGLHNNDKRGVIANAKKHMGKQYVLNMDIKTFYPSIKKDTIANVFRLKPFNFSEPMVNFLTNICCLDYLPTGAPASPVLSNIVCWWLDEKLRLLADEKGLIYTRYVDDLTFSGDNLVKEEMVQQVTKILLDFELRVNEKKTRLHTRTSRQMVTGLTVNEKPNVNRKYVRKIRAELHQLSLLPDKADEKRMAKLGGKINFIGDVKGREDSVYIKQIKKYLVILDHMKRKAIQNNV